MTLCFWSICILIDSFLLGSVKHWLTIFIYPVSLGVDLTWCALTFVAYTKADVRVALVS